MSTVLTPPHQTSLSRLADDQVSLFVKSQSVGSRIAKPDALIPRWRPPIDISFAACQQPQFRMPRRTFTGPCFLQELRL